VFELSVLHSNNQFAVHSLSGRKSRKEHDLRRIDNTGHAQLAMRRNHAVEPNRVRIIDSDAEDVYIFSRGSRDVSAEESIRGRRAGRREITLRDGVERCKEVEFDCVTDRGGDGVWRVCQSAVSYGDTVNTGRCGCGWGW